jgi:hypothetical protein
MAAPKGGGQKFMKRNCLREISFWKEWRGWGPGADTGGDASPLGAFDPPGKFLRRETEPLSGRNHRRHRDQAVLVVRPAGRLVVRWADSKNP